MRVVAAPRKFPLELRGRATGVGGGRAVQSDVAGEGRVGGSVSSWSSNAETLRNGVVQVDVDVGHRPGTTNTDAEWLAVLQRDDRELRQTITILQSASTLFAAGLDRLQG